MQIRIIDSLETVPAADWNRLCDAHPLLRHEFLVAMERHGCVGPDFGWHPAHITVHEHGRLVGACPGYLKTNTYGEFVFDHAWADAWQRAGGRWYPKWVSAIPYTPATGPRLLTAANTNQAGIRQAMIDTAIGLCEAQGMSSAHWLFTDENQTTALEKQGLLRRLGCQYHWHNRHYNDFDDFLSRLRSAKRKRIRAERRSVANSGLRIQLVSGEQASPGQLRAASHFYRKTFDEKWGIATFNEAFFTEIAQTMGEQLLLVFALDRERPVAGAICYRSHDTLYGRHWGCDEYHPNLHFELCYYQGIEYCIREGLMCFEPGAQGEHKIARGFLPTPTWSAHWIADIGFRDAVASFLDQETRGMRQHIAVLGEHSPYRRESDPRDAPNTGN